MLAEFGGRAVLLTGDAHADVLAASIRALQEQRGHGRRTPAARRAEARRTTAARTPRRRSCSTRSTAAHYLVPTDGSFFYHPDRAAIARVILHGGPQPDDPLQLPHRPERVLGERRPAVPLRVRHGVSRRTRARGWRSRCESRSRDRRQQDRRPHRPVVLDPPFDVVEHRVVGAVPIAVGLPRLDDRVRRCPQPLAEAVHEVVIEVDAPRRVDSRRLRRPGRARCAAPDPPGRGTATTCSSWCRRHPRRHASRAGFPTMRIGHRRPADRGRSGGMVGSDRCWSAARRSIGRSPRRRRPRSVPPPPRGVPARRREPAHHAASRRTCTTASCTAARGTAEPCSSRRR